MSEVVSVSRKIAGRDLIIETGKLAAQADAAVTVRYGDSIVLATVVASKQPREGIDFFPLLVDYEEKLYAAGKIPGGFIKKEGKPSDASILAARVIDRSIRPLFDERFRNDVQVIITVLSADLENSPEVLGIIGASAAITLADIPFNGPIGAVKMGYVKDELVVNVLESQKEESLMNFIISGKDDKVIMLEGGFNQVSEDKVLEAIEIANKQIKEIIDMQLELKEKASVLQINKLEKQFPLYQYNEKIYDLFYSLCRQDLYTAMQNEDKLTRDVNISKIDKDYFLDKLLESESKEIYDEVLQILEEKPSEFDIIKKKVLAKLLRQLVVKEGKRVDGRSFEDIRQLDIEVGVLPRTHGSALFKRGQTQVLSTVTLGPLEDVQIVDGLGEEFFKRYMHHYYFPPYSVGEVKPLRGQGRREIGHGALAEKALVPVIPVEEDFPYVIRVVSDVLESNGSSSMASVCGSTLALMDAGINIKAPVAGIAIGLLHYEDDYKVLVDIQGLEDFLGEMDFKVAGTTNGITAIQLDLKIEGLTLDIVKEVLDKAKKARLYILDKMLSVISSPRNHLSQYAPSVASLHVIPDKIRDIIGPGGKTIQKIIDETDVKIDIKQDGRVYIYGHNQEGVARAKEIINNIVKEVEVGAVFLGKVVKIFNFGAIVEFAPGKEGLLHISKITDRRINKVEDVLNIGDEVLVKVISVDSNTGRIQLSRRDLLHNEK